MNADQQAIAEAIVALEAGISVMRTQGVDEKLRALAMMRSALRVLRAHFSRANPSSPKSPEAP